jgi:DNA repair exonuclease SbcCD ATPase subunit
VRKESVSTLADNDGNRPPAEPLGTLLVNRGLITAEQLAAALEAQKESGEPLGAIVVAQGFATPATIAQALATQSGGLLKTEYGFATGFGSPTDRPAPIHIGEPPISTARIGVRPVAPVVAVASPAPEAVEADYPTVALAEAPPLVAPVDNLAADQDAVRAELTAASVETERLSSANSRLAEMRADLEQRLAHETQRAASLESELASRDAAIEELRASCSEPTEDAGRVTALEAEIAARDAALEEFRVAAVAWQAAHAELEQQLAQATEHAESAATTESVSTELAELRAEALSRQAVHAELEQRLAKETERAAALEAERASVEELRHAASAAESARVDLEERLAQELAAAALRHETITELRLALDAAIAATPEPEAETQPDPADKWASAERHLLFFQGGEAYELVERAGPPPSPGASVDVAGSLKAQIVTRVGSAPVPGSDLPCAYLIAA